MDVYGASDYAGMSGGKWSFYYGYEFIWCPTAGFVDYVKHQDDCPSEDGHEWAFSASYDGRTVAQYKASEIDAQMDDLQTEANVLRGVARMLELLDIREVGQ